MTDAASPKPGRLGAWLANFHPKHGPAVSQRERWGLRLIGFALGTVGPVGFIQPRAMTIVLGIAAAGAAILPGAFRSLASLPRQPAAAVLGAALVWLLVSLAWSPLPDARWAVDVIGPVLLGLFVLHATTGVATHFRRVLLLVFAASIAVLLLALGVEAATDGAIARFLRGREFVRSAVYSQGAAFAAIFLLPFILALRRLAVPVWIGVLFVVLAPAAAFGLSMRSAQLALVMGVVAGALAWWRPRLVALLLGAAVALYAMIAPWLAKDWLTVSVLREIGIELPTSGWHRIAIWEFAGERIAQSPLFGEGFNAARWWGTQGMTVTLPGESPATGNLVPIHTHNSFLMVWLELGLVGLLLLLALWGVLIAGLWRRLDDRGWAAAAIGALVAVLVHFTISFSPWRAWWVASFFMLALVLIRLRTSPVPRWRQIDRG